MRRFWPGLAGRFAATLLLSSLTLLAFSPSPTLAQSTEPQVSVPLEPVRIEPADAPAQATEHAPAPIVMGDPREVQIFRYDCESELERREVTLFASGTVRLRLGPPGRERMGLAELGPDRLDGAIHRLEEEDLSQIGNLPQTLTGAWIPRCALDLAIPGRPVQKLHFGKEDALPLALSRIVAVTESVAAEVTLLEGDQRLPEGYEPARFDRLRRADGVLFEIQNLTDDGKGVELRAVDQPLAMYVFKDDLRQLFIQLEPRFGTRAP
ncbi:MAG TPA: hypothetical protein VN851_21890 [Thermoanaerobaculia bacterium]|nr:hypothetical protein [Thermoanaerobaculia bacterium]